MRTTRCIISPLRFPRVPLVLGPGPPSTSNEASIAVLATYASQRLTWPEHVARQRIADPGPDGLVASDYNVTAGSSLGFIVTDSGNSPPGAQIYCALVARRACAGSGCDAGFVSG
ncbi:hypothetical protein AcW1_003070 [Taiwanofungus camphoratus]|nr:hypothetical protein AcW1_003070 [Antrodia cinnamomea]KAI0942438.1 hypothetical protein AcW1_003070 [Antrodia cinnamomea]